MTQSVIAGASRLVVKVGSALVTNDGRGLDHARLALWSEQIAKLTHMGKEIVLVSSGAIAEGVLVVYWNGDPVQIIDERYSLEGTVQHTVPVPRTAGGLTHELALRLDTYNAVGSIMQVATVVTGYEASCGEPDHPYPEGDLNLNCLVDIGDFALFTEGWLDCTAPDGCP